MVYCELQTEGRDKRSLYNIVERSVGPARSTDELERTRENKVEVIINLDGQ